MPFSQGTPRHFAWQWHKLIHLRLRGHGRRGTHGTVDILACHFGVAVLVTQYMRPSHVNLRFTWRFSCALRGALGSGIR